MMQGTSGHNKSRFNVLATKKWEERRYKNVSGGLYWKDTKRKISWLGKQHFASPCQSWGRFASSPRPSVGRFATGHPVGLKRRVVHVQRMQHLFWDQTIQTQCDLGLASYVASYQAHISRESHYLGAVQTHALIMLFPVTTSHWNDKVFKLW